MIETFYKALDDYAVDRRGDVGSWVREEAMNSLKDYVHIILESKDTALISAVGANTPEFFEKFVSEYLQQLNEKIDKIREVAGRCLQSFFKFTLPLTDTDFSQRSELLCLFISEEAEKDAFDSEALYDKMAFLPWRNAKFVFSAMKPFFDSETYSESILKGLITSSGGLTESTLKASQNSLFEYLSEAAKAAGEGGTQKKRALVNKLIKIFTRCQKQDRVTVPLMKTIEMLLSADYLSETELQPEILEVHRVSVAECNKSKNIVKLIAGVGLFSGLLSLEDVEVQKKAVKTLLFLLFHNFPKVRQMAAEKLYTGLLTLEEYDDLIPGGEDAYDEINEVLSETDWGGIDAKILTADLKAKLYALFGHEWVPPKK